MEDKEHIYEAEIKPLVKQIFATARKQGIPFYAAFQVADATIKGTCGIPAEADERLHVAYAVINGEVAFSVIGQASDEPMKVHD